MKTAKNINRCKQGSIQTGVTAVLPHKGNCFKEKCPAAVHVINGFGKSTGLLQVQELGTIETPVLLTNLWGDEETAVADENSEEALDIFPVATENNFRAGKLIIDAILNGEM